MSNVDPAGIEEYFVNDECRRLRLFNSERTSEDISGGDRYAPYTLASSPSTRGALSGHNDG
jgi:hypothetical protein